MCAVRSMRSDVCFASSILLQLRAPGRVDGEKQRSWVLNADGLGSKVRRSKWKAPISVQTVLSMEYLWRRATHGEKPACNLRK